MMHSWFCQGSGLGTRCLRVDTPWVYSICVVCGWLHNSVWFHLSLVVTFNVGNASILFDTIFINWHEYQTPNNRNCNIYLVQLLVLSSLSLSLVLILIFIILFTDCRKQKGHDYRDLRFRQKSNYFPNCGLLNLA